MKIAFINIYQGAVERGAETFVNELSRKLSEKHFVKVYGFSVKTLPRWPVLWRTYLDPFGLQIFWYTLKLIPSFLKERFDVVVPVNGGWQPALVRLVTWVYGGKMIISGQSGIGWDDRNNLWCFPDRFVALTKFAGKWAGRVNPHVKIEVIPNGVDVERFLGERSKVSLRLARPVILSVGALTASKRLDLAIKAVSRLKKGSLLLVGKGEARNKLREAGDGLLKEKYLITSFSHSDMPKVYKSADLFTFPTNPNESFGIVMLEAMASGLAVVANDDPIRREIVGSAGSFVDPRDPKLYAQALDRALKTNWGNKPLNQAKKFDWGKIALKYDELFKQIVK
jgi:glycosyltransferase involved in cell wall biosynthesis